MTMSSIPQPDPLPNFEADRCGDETRSQRADSGRVQGCPTSPTSFKPRAGGGHGQ
jgi:hypothetical protein